MSNKKKQYYVVVNGRKPGIYSKWFGIGEASEQVKGFAEAIYKGFYTRNEAINWLKEFPIETLMTLAPNLVKYVNSNKVETPALIEGPASVAQSGKTNHDDLSLEKKLIYTDGGALTNPGAGGYGVVLKHKGHRKELSGGFRLTTNNRMEILACIEGLRALKHKSDVVIFSDSQYVVNSMSQGWAKRWKAKGWMRNSKDKAKNPDLWEQLLELCSYHNVEFRWIKGHNNTAENERCDQLATDAARNKDLPTDVIYELAKSNR
ncbi:MAG: ribonuclease HI [Anaerolineales bacterium]|nr:ribonuclease HI [Anaerolineales bacterium]